MREHYWPHPDSVKSLTDSELVDYAQEVYDLKVASLDKLDPDTERAAICDARRQLIRKVLKGRVMKRERKDADPELADLDEPLAEVVSDIRPHTITVEF